MAFCFNWAIKWFIKRHIHFPAGKFMCALSPRADCGLRLCLCCSYSPFILLECTGGLSPSTAPGSTVLGAVQRWFEDLSSLSLCKCPGPIVLGTKRHTPLPHGLQTVHIQVVVSCISVVSWRDRRKIRAAQKINHSALLQCLPSQPSPWQVLPPEPHHFHFTGFLAQSGPGKHWPICWGCVCVSQDNPHLCEMKLCSALIWSYTWVHPAWFGQPW